MASKRNAGKFRPGCGLRPATWNKLQPGLRRARFFTTCTWEHAMENTSKDELITDMKVVLTDVEDLLKAATAATGETAAALREKAAGRLKLASEKLTDLQEAALLKGKEAAKVTDEYVHDHPWTAVGIAAATGFLVGLLVSHR